MARRTFNGRFWVKRDKPRNRAAASRAFSGLVCASKFVEQRDKEHREQLASIERKHGIAHEMNALFDQQANSARESWERFIEQHRALQEGAGAAGTSTP
jgi:hypothetical protein